MSPRKITLALLLSPLLAVQADAFPQFLLYQGRYTDNGVAPTGAVPMEFRITGGAAVACGAAANGTTLFWTSGAQSVSASNGVFAYKLGLLADQTTQDPVYSNINWAAPGVVYTIDVCVSGTTLLPHEPIGSGVFALYSSSAGYAASTTLDSSSVTLQGNSFNSADRLVRLDASGRYPALDGSLITNLPAGATGPAGPAGATGAAGAAGAAGAQGAQGVQGVQGDPGAAGAAGAAGAQGAQGVQGDPGAAGAAGAAGAQGAQGAQGVQGDPGAAGAAGAAGAQGAQGAQGVQGDPGAAGAAGAAGAQGVQGDPGAAGAAGAAGAQGVQGDPGAAGAAGAAGAQGVQGDPGAAGAAGAAGAQGVQGDPGAAGAAGAAGAQGVQGDPGAAGAAGAAGAQGAQGDPGAAGAAGAAGATGPSGLLAFGYFYALMPADNAATVAVGGAVSFPQDGASSGISRVPASPSVFTLPAIGVYEVTWQASVAEAGQLILGLDSGVGIVEVGHTAAGRATGTSVITNHVLIVTTAVNSLLSVRNPSGNPVALTMTVSAGGTHAVSASLLIKQIQ